MFTPLLEKLGFVLLKSIEGCPTNRISYCPNIGRRFSCTVVFGTDTVAAEQNFHPLMSRSGASKLQATLGEILARATRYAN